MNCGGMRQIYRRVQLPRTAAAALLLWILGVAHHGVIMVHMIIVPDRFQIVARERIGVQHPPERLRNEPAVRCIALFLRSNAEGTEYWPTILGLVPALLGVTRGNAP